MVGSSQAASQSTEWAVLVKLPAHPPSSCSMLVLCHYFVIASEADYYSERYFDILSISLDTVLETA